MEKVTLCGSTRFRELFEIANRELSLRGYTVYSVAMFGKEVKDKGKKGNYLLSNEDKLVLDAVHMAKIANSDAILVITDETGYIGESTKREIFFARIMGKTVRSLTWTQEIDRLAHDTNFRSENRPCPPI